MMGLIQTKHHRYLFRDDHCHEPGIWAWNIDEQVKDKMQTHKWVSMPKGIITVFDMDDPPATVSYIPALG